MKVWLCSDGVYSDYHVTGVYSGKETAERITKAYDWNDVEEFELDPPLPSEYREGYSHYRVTLSPYGNEPARASVGPSFCQDKTGWWGRAYKHPNTWQFTTTCWARDAEHAIKIGAERMAQTPRPKEDPS